MFTVLSHRAGTIRQERVSIFDNDLVGMPIAEYVGRNPLGILGDIKYMAILRVTFRAGAGLR